MKDIQVNITEPSSTEKQFSIEVPREQFDAIFETRVRKYSKEIKLNGYRQGNVPKRVIAERFQEPITNEAIEQVVEQAIRKACEDNNITPVSQGKVEDLKNEDGQPITFTATLEVDAEVEFENYTDLGIKVEEAEAVTEKDLEEQFKGYAERMAKEEVKEGAGKEGDIALGEYQSITLDGEEQSLDDQKTFRIEIGADKLPEFNKAFKGAKAGDETSISVKYAKDYEIKELAGKKGEYKVLVSEIKERKLPNIDDEFAKQIGAESMDALKERTQKDMEESRKREKLQAAQKSAVEKIVEANPFDVPKARINHYISYKFEQFTGQKQQIDASLLPEEQRKPLIEEATLALKEHKILEFVGKKEKIKPKQPEVDEKIKEMATQFNMEFETLKDSLRKNGRINEVREELKREKTFEFILGL
jgi:trigger factor